MFYFININSCVFIKVQIISLYTSFLSFNDDLNNDISFDDGFLFSIYLNPTLILSSKDC